jgi:hypothetical protein
MKDSMDLLNQEEDDIQEDIACGTFHLAHGHAYYVFRRNIHEGQTAFLLRSDRKLIHVLKETKDGFEMNDGSVIRRLSIATSFRSWSDNGIRAFVSGQCVPQTFPNLFERVKTILRKTAYAEEAAIDLMATFAIGSYFVNHFGSTCYLSLTGPAGSGKSAVATTLLRLCFNGCSGETVASFGKASSSAIFRSIAENQGVVCFDDIEIIANASASSALRVGLLTSYKKSTGTQVLTVRGKVFPYPLYVPKIFTSIAQAEPVLRTRLLEIQLTQARNFKPADIPESEFKALRDDLHTLAMTEAVFQDIRVAASEAAADKRYHGRFAEITIGQRALAALCGVTLDLERYYPARAAQPLPAVNFKALVRELLSEFRDLSVLHVHAAAALKGLDTSLTKIGLEMASCGLLKPKGQSTIHGVKSTTHGPRKKTAVPLAGKFRRRSRDWCPQAARKHFDSQKCSGCQYADVCLLRNKLLQ